ncbi:ankyrin repeat-containing protein [Anaeramoeba flamelloides]|uniref:Ankyrin repeat-containing protein n=1 Tax=Anaeramoeba flamelloides TaxID=1746091 RepID=A0ABQ8YAP9_9EUKA|nr:ankyrin repeat-containing protein [Anaeramoeba flamelloides]
MTSKYRRKKLKKIERGLKRMKVIKPLLKASDKEMTNKYRQLIITTKKQIEERKKKYTRKISLRTKQKFHQVNTLRKSYNFLTNNLIDHEGFILKTLNGFGLTKNDLTKGVISLNVLPFLIIFLPTKTSIQLLQTFYRKKFISPKYVVEPIGWNMLHYACSYNPSKELIKFLIKNGLRLCSETANGITCFDLLKESHPEIKIHKIVEIENSVLNRSNTTTNNTEYSPEKSNSLRLKYETFLVKMKLQKDLQVDFDFIEQLKNQKVNLNITDASNESLLHYYITNSNLCYKNFEILLGYDLDPNICNADGNFPIHLLCIMSEGIEKKEFYLMFELLLKRTKNINALNNFGDNILNILLEIGKQPIEPIIELLQSIFFQFNPLHKNDQNESLLHQICKLPSPPLKVVKYLISKKFSINLQDKFGKTCLHYTCLQKKIDIEILQYFLEHKADPLIEDNDNNTPFHYCFRKKRELPSNVFQLVQKYFKLQSKNSKQKTILEILLKDFEKYQISLKNLLLLAQNPEKKKGVGRGRGRGREREREREIERERERKKEREKERENNNLKYNKIVEETMSRTEIKLEIEMEKNDEENDYKISETNLIFLKELFEKNNVVFDSLYELCIRRYLFGDKKQKKYTFKVIKFLLETVIDVNRVFPFYQILYYPHQYDRSYLVTTLFYCCEQKPLESKPLIRYLLTKNVRIEAIYLDFKDENLDPFTVLLPRMVYTIDRRNQPIPNIDYLSETKKESVKELLPLPIETIKLFIEEKNINLNRVDHDGITPFHQICINISLRTENVDFLKYCFAKGANPNQKSRKTGQTPFYLFCYCLEIGDPNILSYIKVFLENGANPSIPDKKNLTPFYQIEQKTENVELIKCFKENSKIHEIIPSKLFNSKFSQVVQRDGEINKLESNIRNVQDFNEYNKDGKTPFHSLCLFSGKPTPIGLAIKNGADPKLLTKNQNPETCLSLLCQCTNVNLKSIQLLVSAGCDVNNPNTHLKNPLDFLTQHFFNKNLKTSQLFNYLIGKGAKFKFVKKNKYDVFHHYFENEMDDRMIMDRVNNLEIFLKQGFDPKITNNKKDTILHAICNNNPLLKEVQLLLKNNVDPTIVNIMGKNALEFLVMRLKETSRQKEYMNLLQIAYLLLISGRTKMNQKLMLKELKTGTNRTRRKRLPRVFVNFVQPTLKSMLKMSFNCLTEDFSNFFESSHDTDLKINTIGVHKTILEARINQSIDVIVDVLQDYNQGDLRPFFHWVYSDQIPDNKIFLEICKLLDLTDLKNNTLKSSMKKLFLNENSKNIIIKLKNKQQIKVHKRILQCRSKLFQESLKLLKPNENTIKDFSKKSIKAMQILVRYLYTGEIDHRNVNSNIVNELQDSINFYQLNKRSNFQLALKFGGPLPYAKKFRFEFKH